LQGLIPTNELPSLHLSASLLCAPVLVQAKQLCLPDVLHGVP
jgi:hypothetical protein